MMRIFLFLQLRHARWTWLTSMAVLLLHRAPMLRVLFSGEVGGGIPGGQLLRAAFPLVAGAVAVNTLTGATQFSANPRSPATATVGTGFTMVCSLTGAPSTPRSYTFSGLPAGLSVTNGTRSGVTWTVNASSGSIVGTPTTAGTYTVSVRAYANTNGGGDKSPVYSYVVNVAAAATSPPGFTTQPAAQSVTAGTDLTFTVAASGTPAPTYQWRKDGANLAGRTAATLALVAVTAGDAGSYTCVATNSAGTATSTAATLTVNAAASAPAFTLQPTAQTATAGMDVTFTVAASGTPAPAYQWRKDGSNLAGRTAATLGLTAVAAGDAGTYDCVATNTAGTATSTAATLSVLPATSPPVFTTQPVAQSAPAGGAVSFAVVVNGNPTPTLQWRKAGVNLAGKTAATLVLTNLTALDAGGYSCVATNPAGTATSAAVSLTVVAPAPPVISSPPVPMTSLAGGGAFFAVQATGTGLSYQWLKNGTGIPGATQPTLYLADIQLADAGAYSVLISDSTGVQVTSTAASLNVAATGSSRLVNMSARAGVGTGAGALIPGFAIEGDVALTLLVRGVGPHLATFDVTGVLADPVMTLYQGGTPIAANDDWEQNANLAALVAATADEGAFPLAGGSKDCAMLLTLNPGVYTVVVSGKDGATGEALVEIYVVNP